MNLHCETFGNFHKPACVFLHGFLGCFQDFNETIRLLKDAFFCIAIDLPGHGKSSDITIKTAYEIYPLIMKTLEPFSLTKASFIGYSMGARIGFYFIEKQCPLFDKFTLISGAIDTRDKLNRIKSDLYWANILEKEPFDYFLDLWYKQPLFDSLHHNPLLYQTIKARRKNGNRKALKQMLLTMSPVVFQPIKPSSQAFTSPLLYIYGNKDEKYKLIAERIKSLFTRSTIKEVLNCGHAPHIEQPNELSKLIYEYEVPL